MFLRIKSYRKDPDLNDVDVTNLDKIGHFSKFNFFKKNNFYVDEWDVNNVKDFGSCFENCFYFDSDLGNWDVSKGVNFFKMFSNCLAFNKPILNFDVSNGVDFSSMFFFCKLL